MMDSVLFKKTNNGWYVVVTEDGKKKELSYRDLDTLDLMLKEIGTMMWGKKIEVREK